MNALPNRHQPIMELTPDPSLIVRNPSSDDDSAMTVSIVTYLIDGKGRKRLVLVKEYRKIINNYLIQTPGGKIERGETALEATYRELQEETGLHVSRIKVHSPTVIRSIYRKAETAVVVVVEVFDDRPEAWLSPEGDHIEVMALDFEGLKKMMSGNTPISIDAYLVVSDILSRGSL